MNRKALEQLAVVKLPRKSKSYIYTELLSHECREYLTAGMMQLFKDTGNNKAYEVMVETNKNGTVHPLMNQMIVNTNANSYERVFACFRGEKEEKNLLGYVWLLVDFDIYGSVQLTVKQFFIVNKLLSSFAKARLLKRFLVYIVDIGGRSKVSIFRGGVMQRHMVNFWSRVKGFKGVSVEMEYEGTAEQFKKDNPKIFGDAK